MAERSTAGGASGARVSAVRVGRRERASAAAGEDSMMDLMRDDGFRGGIRCYVPAPRWVAATHVLGQSSAALRALIEQEAAENPALEVEDCPICGRCGRPLQQSEVCPYCVMPQASRRGVPPDQ